MSRLVLSAAVFLGLVCAALPARAEIDCAQCRAICKARSYPDDIRPEVSSKGIVHRTAEAQAAFNLGMKNDPGLGGKNAQLAVQAYKEAVMIDPENSQYRNHLAAALLTTGAYKEAVYNLEKAIDLVPSEPKYLVNLGYAYHRKGDEQRALVWYMRALMLDAKDVRARLFTAYALDIVGMREEAILEFRRVLLQDPQNPGALTALKRLGATVAKTSTPAPSTSPSTSSSSSSPTTPPAAGKAPTAGDAPPDPAGDNGPPDLLR